MNACSFTDGNQIKHSDIKWSLEYLFKKMGIHFINEPVLLDSKNPKRADIYLPLKNILIDVTCTQTNQNHMQLKKAMQDAYDKKVKLYNNILYLFY